MYQQPSASAPVPKAKRSLAAALRQFSVFLSIVLSIASLILGAIASLAPHQSQAQLKGLTVASLIINAVSVALSALTSLDWRDIKEKEQEFADMLLKVGHTHVGIVAAEHEGVAAGGSRMVGRVVLLKED